MAKTLSARPASPSTVGRARGLTATASPMPTFYADDHVLLQLGDCRALCPSWDPPKVIVSDGAYGLLGFAGDTADHVDVAQWYMPHIVQWSQMSRFDTTLWFWNSEIGWAMTHPVLEAHGWRYRSCNVWNKGLGHIAGNSNTQTLRRFPVVTEVCVQYERTPQVNGEPVQRWLLSEWKRTGMPLWRANQACGVKNAAVRKYFDQGHMWYMPPPPIMARLAAYANAHGAPGGRPYYALDGKSPATAAAWQSMRPPFACPAGVTNVWDRGQVRGAERIRDARGRVLHLNQKPLDLLERLITASSTPGDVVWEPFGGVFSAALAARRLRRRAFAAEVQPSYFASGIARFDRLSL